MGAPYLHIAELLDFKGLDLRSSDLKRPRGFSSDGSINVMHSPQGGLKHRYGSKYITGSYGRTGIARFDTTSMTGVSKTEIIAFGASSLNDSTYPARLVKDSFVLTNSHATLAATVTHYYDEATSQFRFKIVRSTTLIDQALGTGFEVSPYLLSSLETAVDLLTSFAMSTPTVASTTAAFMELITGATVAANGGTLTVYYYYWSTIPSTATDTGVYATLKNPIYEIGSESYRNVSTAVVRSVLYMSSGTNSPTAVAGGTPVTSAVITKYDGQDFYRAGFANAHIAGGGNNENRVTAVLYALAGAAPQVNLTDSKGTRTVAVAQTASDYNYGASIIRIDKAGNRIESNLAFDPTFTTGGGAEVTQVRIEPLSPFYTAANGYGLRTAKVNGVMTTTLALTVDAGHNMTAGSIAYFWDTVQSRFIQREVTVVGPTTVTLSTSSLDLDPSSKNYDAGGNVSTYDNAYISNNFRIAIWRTMANGTSLFLTDERPLGTSSSQYEYDDTADTSLGAEYVEPDFPHDEPPQGRYLCSFNDQLIITGNDLRSCTVFFSDETPEYFPKDSHEFDLVAKVNGAKQTGEVLACGTRNTLSVVSGDLRNFAFRVSSVGNNIGITSHFSMQEAMEGVLMFSSYKGPYVLVGGRDLRPLGAVEVSPGIQASRLESYWTTLYGPTASKPVFERALSAVLPNDNLYVLYVPFEDPTAPAFEATGSVVFAYNYARDAWYQWSNLFAAGGLAVLDDELIMSTRTYDGSGTPSYDDVVSYTAQQQKRKAQYNYADHNAAITFRNRAHWEALGKPGLFKRFLRCKIYTHETREATTTALTLKTYVDYDTSKLSTTDTLSFPSTTLKSLTPKIKSETCKSMQIVFESTAFYQPICISGYELEAMAAFRAEFKE